jgi:hypothetical protein
MIFFNDFWPALTLDLRAVFEAGNSVKSEDVRNKGVGARELTFVLSVGATTASAAPDTEADHAVLRTGVW